MILQGDRERVRYDKNDNRFLLLPEYFYSEDGTKIQMPWLWAGFDGTWCFRRTSEAKRPLN